MCTQVQEGPFYVHFGFDGKLDVIVDAVDVSGEPFHVVLMNSYIRVIDSLQCTFIYYRFGFLEP